MQTVGPITVTLNVETTEDDPAQAGGNPSVALQIQNSSCFVLTVLTIGAVYTIQPFFAQTVPVSGQPVQITPTQNPSGLTGNTITIVWLLDTEQSPMNDGPLNLPISTLEQLLQAGQATAIGYQNLTVGSGPILPGIAGKTLVVSSLVIQPGITTSGIIPVLVQTNAGNVMVYEYAGTIPQPAVAIAYPTGFALAPGGGLDLLIVGGPLADQAVATAVGLYA